MRTSVLALAGAVLVVGVLLVAGQVGGPGVLDRQDDADLDLREANVVGVAVTGEDGAYTFDVTLHHDDDGEEGYANWWQVESLDGDRLGRRDLAHPHGTREFTRSATVEVPANVAWVVVRGHDETHGYGGLAWLVNLETGDALALDQGSEPVNVSDAGSAFPNEQAVLRSSGR